MSAAHTRESASKGRPDAERTVARVSHPSADGQVMRVVAADGTQQQPCRSSLRREAPRLPAVLRVQYFTPLSWDDNGRPGAGVREIARHIARAVGSGTSVLVVATASQRALDAAATRAARLSATADSGERATIMAIPEIQSAGELSIELARLGIPATVLNPATAGPVTRGAPLDADPRRLNAPAIARSFADTPVVILPGALGRDEHGATTSLGAGGAELAAVFAADRLATDVEIIDASPLGGGFHIGVDDAIAARRVTRRAGLYARQRGQIIRLGSLGDVGTAAVEPETRASLQPVSAA